MELWPSVDTIERTTEQSNENRLTRMRRLGQGGEMGEARGIDKMGRCIPIVYGTETKQKKNITSWLWMTADGSIEIQ